MVQGLALLIYSCDLVVGFFIFMGSASDLGIITRLGTDD